MAFLEARGISMRLPNDRWLFRDIDIALDHGQTLVIRGASGVGKTTLLKCLAQLVSYDEGSCTLGGQTPADMGFPVWRSRVMYVPQRPAVHAGTPMDLFRLVSKYVSQRSKALDDPIKIGLDWNLSEAQFNEPWSCLSGGEMQRCSLAIALAMNPDVLLLDEPTSALDPESILLVEKTLKNRTCILITHNPDQEKRLATHSLTLTRTHPPTPIESSDDMATLQRARRNSDVTVHVDDSTFI